MDHPVSSRDLRCALTAGEIAPHADLAGAGEGTAARKADAVKTERKRGAVHSVAPGMAQSVWEPPEELSTVNDYLDFWAKHLDKAMAMAGAAVGLDFTTSRLSWDDADERTLREGSGLELCNSVITSGGLAMVVDLPASVRRDDEIEFERWGQDHDKVIILCEGGTLDAASGLALYLVLRRAQRACCLRSGQQKLPAVFDRCSAASVACTDTDSNFWNSCKPRVRIVVCHVRGAGCRR